MQTKGDREPMKQIKDIEEKKLIIAYLFKKRNGIGRESLYREWSSWWTEDFEPDGYCRPYRVYSGHLVYPYSKSKKETPSIDEEADCLLQELFDRVCLLMQDHTVDELKEMLKEHREQNFKVLKTIAARTGYHIDYLRKRSSDHPLYLATYRIYTFPTNKKFHTDEKGKYIVDKGTFDEMLQHITIIKQRPKRRSAN